MSEQGNKCLLENIDKLPAEENILIVGDVNLPHVDWEVGCVKAPENTRDKILLNAGLRIFRFWRTLCDEIFVFLCLFIILHYNKQTKKCAPKLKKNRSPDTINSMFLNIFI